MSIRRFVILLSAAGLPVAMAGCASTSNATAATFSYIHGDQRATLGATPPQITDAAVAAGQDLQLAVDSHISDGLLGNVKMHTVDGTKVEVSIKSLASNQSEVAVRVGTFGDKVLQQRIMDKIKQHVMPGLAEPVASSPTHAAPPPLTPAPAAAPAPSDSSSLLPPPAPTPAPAPAPAPAPIAPTPANPLSPTPANPLSPTTGQ